MSGEGLLGFIKGVSGTLAQEYENQNAEAADIRKEGRAEERAMRAEKRRILAEEQAARYQKKLNLEFKPQELDVVADHERGLIESGTDPALLRDVAQNEAELARINAGKDPASARKEYDDMSEAGRIRAGLDSEKARLDAGTDAAKTKATTEASLEARREDDRIRRDEGLPRSGSRAVDVSFTVSEATTQLRDDLSAQHGINLSATRERNADPRKGGSRLVDLRDGEDTLASILGDSQSRDELRQEIALKIHNTEEKRLKEAANSKEITSLDEVSELAGMIAERADQTVIALEAAQKMVAEGQDAAKVHALLRAKMAEAYGEPEEDDKQSTAFRSMFSAFKASIKK
jgi:hypothetical protein